MQWTRRAWLQTVLSGAIAAAVVDPLAIIPSIRARFDPTVRFWVFDVLVSAENIGWFRLERKGDPVLVAPLGKGTVYRWWSMPGEEICGDGLVNTSDFDVKLISMMVRQGDETFSIDEHGVALSLAA